MRGGGKESERCISGSLRGFGLAMVNQSVDSHTPDHITHAQARGAVGQSIDKCSMIPSDTTWTRGLTGTKLIGSTRCKQPLSMFRAFSLRLGDVKISHERFLLIPQVPPCPPLAPTTNIGLVSGLPRNRGGSKTGFGVDKLVVALNTAALTNCDTSLFYDARFFTYISSRLFYWP